MRGAGHAPQFTVRERVLAALDDQLQRPRDLANSLGLDRTQASRALRRLESAGRVKTVGPGDGQDGRAVFWREA